MRNRSLGGWVLVGFLLFGAGGCVGLRQYNFTPEQYLRTVTDPETGATADLCIIEFDDEGEFWDPRQLQDTLALIRLRNEESPNGIVTPVFIHGWKNNADWSREKGNLRSVAREIAESAAMLQQAGTSHPSRVVGVYIGWRGDIARGPLSREMSFWNRLLAADRIASLNLKEALFEITLAAKERTDSKVIMYGHSMGGRILFSAMAPSLISASMRDHGVSQVLPVDLVVMVNPANRAVDVAGFIDLMKRRHIRLVTKNEQGVEVKADGPLIASITSEADLATGLAFPFGQGFVRLVRSYRDDEGPGRPSQGYLAAHTEGHTSMLISHHAQLVDGKVTLTAVPDRYNDTPYWVIQTTPDICRHHSDLSNPHLNELIQMLLRRRQAYSINAPLYLQSDDTRIEARDARTSTTPGEAAPYDLFAPVPLRP